MLPFHMFAALHLPFVSSPPRLCVQRLPRRGWGELCVKIPTSYNSRVHSSPKISAKPRQKKPFQISALRTLSFSVSCKSRVCHSYENCRVYTNNSQSGTHYSPVSTRHCTQVLSFHILAHALPINLHNSPKQPLRNQTFPHSLPSQRGWVRTASPSRSSNRGEGGLRSDSSFPHLYPLARFFPIPLPPVPLRHCPLASLLPCFLASLPSSSTIAALPS